MDRSSGPGPEGPTGGSGGRSRSVTLLKLGGSLITDKARPDTARPEVIRRLAAEIAGALPGLEEELVLGHGSGSFGHPAAARHGLGSGAAGRPGPEGVSGTQERAAALHRRVMGALREVGVPAFSVAPSSAAVASGGAVAALAVEPVTLALEMGLVPVMYGDVAMDRERGAVILSTETVLEAVGVRLEERGWAVRRALWAGATGGVYGADGRTIPVVRPETAASALAAAAGAAAPDVTGGMAHRLETALRLARRGVGSWIGDGREPGALARALGGEEVPGTRVPPAREARSSPGAGPEA